MTFVPAPDCAEAVIQATYGGVNIANVINFKKFGGYDQTAIDALAALVDVAVGDAYLGLLSNGVAYSGTTVRGLSDIIDLSGFNDAFAGPGELATAGLPANVTLCITLRTGFTGRSARGRFFAMPTVADQLSTPDAFVSTFGTQLVSFLTDLKAAALVLGWTMVIVSRFSNGVPRGTAIATPVTNIVARNNLTDSQRHRLPRGH